MKIDVIRNTITLDDKKKVNLDHYRRFLLDNYSQLCSKHFIKLIISNGKKKATYDWDNIFILAHENGAPHKFQTNRTWK